MNGDPDEKGKPAHELLRRINSSWMAQALYVAAELEIAELLADGPKTSGELAGHTNVHAPALHQLMRALTTLDVCMELDDGSFVLTETGALLRAGHPESLRSWIIWWATNLWQAWGNLLYSVRTGQSARKMLSGAGGFLHLDNDPAQAAVFNQALVELTRLAVADILHAYDFSRFKTIMDVGGGYGELLLAVLKSDEGLSGILFDRPHALDGARNRFAKADAASRCEFMAGDFFTEVPGNADLYILKSIIHDWDDRDSLLILRNCHRAMKDGQHLLLIERVLPKRLDQSSQHQELARSDLTMLVGLGAGERTEDQYCQLLEAAGFRVNPLVPTAGAFSIIEAVKHG